MKKMICFWMVLCITPLSAQIISVKTYPVLSEQSLFSYPSKFHAMRGIEIALGDEIREAFTNPASLTSITQSVVVLSPRTSTWSYDRQSDFRSGSPYSSKTFDRMSASRLQTQGALMFSTGGFGVAAIGDYQRLSSTSRTENTSTGSTIPPREMSIQATNKPFQIGFGVLGLKTASTEVSFGAQLAYLDIKGVDGLQFLYPDATSLTVGGKVKDVRVGTMVQVAGMGRFEAFVGESSLHKPPTALYPAGQPPVINHDESRTSYMQLNFRMLLSERFYIGFRALANWKDIPQLPNYPIAGIPRDPGEITAYNLGVGASWRTSPSTLLAVEYLVEPIETRTWVVAEQDRDLGNGKILRKGSHEQDNDYTFLNHIVRGGIEIAAEDWLVLRFGSQIRSYRYDYHNKNFIWNSEQSRSPQTSWTEILLAGSTSARWGNLEFSYLIESLQGRGLLEQQRGWFFRDALNFDLLLVPNDWLTVRPVPVVSHQFTIQFYLL